MWIVDEYDCPCIAGPKLATSTSGWTRGIRGESCVELRSCSALRIGTNRSKITAKQKQQPRFVVRASAKAMGDIISSKEDAGPRITRFKHSSFARANATDHQGAPSCHHGRT